MMGQLEADLSLLQWAMVTNIAIGIGWLVASYLYSAFFHPLAVYPGPKLWAMSRVPYALMIMSGKSHKRMAELHRQYGPVLRVGPKRLALQCPEAWNEVMGHRKVGEGENGKTLEFFPRPTSVGSADRENHRRQRRILSHGFSAKAMVEQQPLIIKYINLLMKQLEDHSVGGQKAVDVVPWLNFTTFDIVGDLTFGEPFGSLVSGKYHPWVGLIFDSVKAGSLAYVIRGFPLLAALAEMLVPPSLEEKRRRHESLTAELAEKRIAAGSQRSDFMNAMLHNQGEKPLTKQEIYDNASTLIVAGSETTATALSGLLYYLCKNPTVHQKLKYEVRTTFEKGSDMDLINTQQLSYLQACIKEGLRIYPPIPIGIPRLTPPEGSNLFGKHVPGGTKLEIWQWPMYHSEKFFTRPKDFCPERWLGNDEFKGDCLDVVQAFSFGPRNCLGQNLAYAEMRLILARIVHQFDVTLESYRRDSREWIEQDVFTLWDKPSLNLYLRVRDI